MLITIGPSPALIYSASPTVSQPVFLLDTTNKSPLSNHALMEREGTEKPQAWKAGALEAGLTSP